MNLEIITPNGVVFKQEVDRVTAPGSKGSFQVLNHHADLLSNLEIGSLKVEYNNFTDFFTCNFGVIEVKNNSVSILAESSENHKDIDRARAENAKERAEKRLNSHGEGVDFDRAQIALNKALNRLKLSGMKLP